MLVNRMLVYFVQKGLKAHLSILLDEIVSKNFVINEIMLDIVFYTIPLVLFELIVSMKPIW